MPPIYGEGQERALFRLQREIDNIHVRDAVAGVLMYKPGDYLQIGGGTATSAITSLNELKRIQEYIGVSLVEIGGGRADGAMLGLDRPQNKGYVVSGSNTAGGAVIYTSGRLQISGGTATSAVLSLDKLKRIQEVSGVSQVEVGGDRADGAVLELDWPQNEGSAIHGGNAVAGVLTYKPGDRLQVGGGTATSVVVSLDDLKRTQEVSEVPLVGIEGARADGAVLELDCPQNEGYVVYGGNAVCGVLVYEPRNRLQVGSGTATSAVVSLDNLKRIQEYTGAPLVEIGGARADYAVLKLDQALMEDSEVRIFGKRQSWMLQRSVGEFMKK
jgi:hypothetical protein